ncbi:preprotein translocase subunit SecG [Flavobacterium sp.]|uniref:preprotein translocase subunit SecG n=1 Tax=Flavobacterium sp. TaxID=239 RepID=UPI003528AC6A
MFTGFLIAITIVCFLLILAVMVQNPKGGGLSSSFGGGGSQQLGGVQKTTDFLDKSTWFLFAALIALILLSSLAFDSSTQGSKVLGNDEVSIPKTEIPTMSETPAKEATQNQATETTEEKSAQ